MLADHELNLNNTERQLLFDIRKELRRTNEILDAILANEKPPMAREVKEILCKSCGGTHENKGQVMACAKKSKKGAAKIEHT